MINNVLQQQIDHLLIGHTAHAHLYPYIRITAYAACLLLHMQEAAMLAAPFAAINFESLKNIKKTFQEFSDKIYYGETLPPVGSLTLSYSKFLDLLEARQVKRITLLADGKVALVEVLSLHPTCRVLIQSTWLY